MLYVHEVDGLMKETFLVLDVLALCSTNQMATVQRGSRLDVRVILPVL